MIRICNLTKRYGKFIALNSIDLEVKSGEAVALWGPNGAGKTTLLKCVLGIVPFEGLIEVGELDVRRRGKQARALIGYAPQEIRWHLDQTVWETVSFYARLRKVPSERVEKLIEEWGLAAARRKWAQNLSGGMKQKLALVISLLSDPPILFLDEPTSSLDAGTRSEFDAALERLKKEGKTLLFCTHRFSELKRIADRIVVLESGRKKVDARAGEVGNFQEYM